MSSTPAYEYHGLMVKYWDLLRGDTSRWADRFMFLEVIRKYGQPVLDIGCSSGRLILDYLSQGIDIDGVDISPEMIGLCRQNAEKRGLNPTLSVQDMTELSLPRRYRTILVPSSSLQLLLDPAQPILALKRIYEHLEPGGACIAPFMTLWQQGDLLESEFTQEAAREDGDLVRRSGWSRFDPVTELEETRDVWEVLREGRVIESETHTQSPATRSYSQEQALILFQRAGFKDIQMFSEFTFEPAKPSDTLFTLLGVKP
jgi:ubiquinone/menaquinone biosynthesis C-methylase UbiE